MDLSDDSDQQLTDRLTQVRKEIDDALARSKNRLAERIAIENELGRRAEAKRIAALPPVDRTARTLTDGSPVTDDHRDLLLSGQQKGYVVLSAEERSKGFVRPVRRTYRHKTCDTTTSMGLALAETYARDPQFYSGTFCVACAAHFPLDQFVWEGTDEELGS